MKVEIWSDIACPWCYLGRRRFEHALQQFDHGNEVEIIWRSFELDPNAEREYPGSVNDMLVAKKGFPRDQVETMHARLTEMAAEEGLEYHFDKMRVGNSFDAHRLIHLAAKHNLQGEMKERIQRAYFTEGKSFGNVDTLIQLGVEVGLDENEVRAALESSAYSDEVRADERRAQQFGVQGVPFFLFEEKYAVSGAQPTDLFVNALEKVWQETHPLIQLVSAGEVCTDDSCSI